MSNIIGIYHGDCLDGTTAAAVLLKKFPNIKLYPLPRSYTTEDANNVINVLDKNTEVYITDFSLSESEMEKIILKAKKTIAIDHHISVKKMFEALAQKHKNNFKFP